MGIINFLFFNILKSLEKWDTWLFLKMNTEWTSTFFDSIAPFIRNKITWVPLYLFLLIMVFYNFGKKSWPWLLFAIITVVITDQISSSLLKNSVARLRPCNVVELQAQIRLMVPWCSGGYSFTSSHAANHFGVGMYFFLTLKPYIKKWAWFFMFWAAIISYSQVYVGVHYPLDIFGGAIVGLAVGWMTNYFFQRYFGMPELLKNRTKE